MISRRRFIEIFAKTTAAVAAGTTDFKLSQVPEEPINTTAVLAKEVADRELKIRSINVFEAQRYTMDISAFNAQARHYVCGLISEPEIEIETVLDDSEISQQLTRPGNIVKNLKIPLEDDKLESLEADFLVCEAHVQTEQNGEVILKNKIKLTSDSYFKWRDGQERTI